jgi:hypothetical protein
MKKHIFLLLALISGLTASAQVLSSIFEGKDAFNTFPVLKQVDVKNIPLKKMPPVDVAKLLEEDKERSGMGVPFRFGYKMDVDYTLSDGRWETRNDRQIWSLRISSPGAYSLNFSFSELILSPGAELYIFNPDGLMVYGPVTAEQNPAKGRFSTDVIAGDEVVIQLFEPAASKEKSLLRISKVIHGYINTFPFSTGLRTLNCHNEVACYPNWEDQSDGVARILINNAYWGSGSLLNNTAQNYRPFLLTAFHCLDISKPWGYLSSQEKSDAENNIYRFRYKRIACSSSSAIETYLSYNQSTFRAAWENTDFALMELTATDITDRLTFLGWDRSGSTSTAGTTIHHPNGDLMKISFDYNSLTSNPNILIDKDGRTHPVGSHWQLIYDSGASEGGSSGAPLFNTAKRVIGQLDGGATESCPPMLDNFGKFNLSWSGGGTNDTRLSNWLDPNGTGATTTNTVRKPGCISGPTLVSASGNSYTLTYPGTVQSVVWSCSSTLQITSSSNTSATVKSVNDGAGWIRAVVNGKPVRDYVVWSGKPLISSITGPSSTPNRQYAYYVAEYNALSAPTGFQWILNPLNGNSVYPSGHTCDIAFYNAGSYQLLVRATNANGTGEYFTTGINVYNTAKAIYVFSPNPVSDVLTVEIQETPASLQTDATKTVYNIRLYNEQGYTVHRTTTAAGLQVEFNVANLPDGTYYLHIDNGSGEQPEKYQIIVKH